MIETIQASRKGGYRDIRRLEELCANIGTLEELFYILIRKDYTLELSVVSIAGGGRVLAIEAKESTWTKGEPKQRGMIFIPEANLKGYRFKPFSPKLNKVPHTCQWEVDEAWWEARCKRLRIRAGEYFDGLIAPPGSMTKLILGYAFSTAGIVEISKDIEEIVRYPRDVAKLKLVYLPKHPEITVIEEIVISLDKLQQLVEKRKAKRELLDGAIVN